MSLQLSGESLVKALVVIVVVPKNYSCELMKMRMLPAALMLSQIFLYWVIWCSNIWWPNMFRETESESDLGTGQIILRNFFTYATSSSFIKFWIFLFKHESIFSWMIINFQVIFQSLRFYFIHYVYSFCSKFSCNNIFMQLSSIFQLFI